MPDRVMELALEALEARRANVETEIARVRKQMGRRGATAGGRGRRTTAAAGGGRPRRRRRSAASRRAQSLKMKAYWAKRRAAAKPKK